MRCARIVLLRRLRGGLLSLLVFLVQASHPGLHPLEVIASEDGPHVNCAVGHATAELSLTLAPIAPAGPVLWSPLDVFPWQGHATFIHRLAPRPPPVLSA